MPTSRRFFLTGATGNIGRHLVAALLADGHQVTALVRDSARAPLPAAVEVVTGDLHVPETFADAVPGHDGVLVLWPGFDDSGLVGSVAALAAGGAPIVQISAAQLNGDRIGTVTPGIWERVETEVRALTGRATFIRSGGIATNTLGWAEQIRAGGPVGILYPQAARSLVHEADLADLARHALLAPPDGIRAWTATGPRTLTQAEQVATIGAALGRTLEVVALDPEQQLAAADPGGRAFLRTALPYWESLVRDPEQVSDELARVLGRPARSYADWVQDHLDDFR